MTTLMAVAVLLTGVAAFVFGMLRTDAPYYVGYGRAASLRRANALCRWLGGVAALVALVYFIVT